MLKSHTKPKTARSSKFTPKSPKRSKKHTSSPRHRPIFTKLANKARTLLDGIQATLQPSSAPLPLKFSQQMVTLPPHRLQIADWVALLNMPHNRVLKAPQTVCTLHPSRSSYPLFPIDHHSEVADLFHPRNSTLRDTNPNIPQDEIDNDPTLSSNQTALITTKASQRPILGKDGRPKVGPDGKDIYRNYMTNKSDKPTSSILDYFSPEPAPHDVTKYLQHLQWPLTGPQLYPYTLRFTHKGHILFNHPPFSHLPMTTTKTIPLNEEITYIFDHPAHLDTKLQHDDHTLRLALRRQNQTNKLNSSSGLDNNDDLEQSAVQMKMPYIVMPMEEVSFHDYPFAPPPPPTPPNTSPNSTPPHQPPVAPVHDLSPNYEHQLNKFYKWAEEEQNVANATQHSVFLSQQQYQLNVADIVSKVELEMSAHRPTKFVFQHKYETVIFPATQNAIHDEHTGDFVTTGNAHDILLPSSISPTHFPCFPHLPLSSQHTISSPSTSTQSSTSKQTQPQHQQRTEQTFDYYLSEILPYALQHQARTPIRDPSKILTIMRNPITKPVQSPDSTPTSTTDSKKLKPSKPHTSSSNTDPTLLTISPYLTRQQFTSQFPTSYQLKRSPFSALYDPTRDQLDQVLVPSETIVYSILQHLTQSEYIHDNLIPSTFFDLIGPSHTDNQIDYFYTKQQHNIMQLHAASTAKEKTNLLNKSMLYSLSPLFYQIGNNSDRLIPPHLAPSIFHQLREFTYQHHNPIIFQPERLEGDLSSQSTTDLVKSEPNQYQLYLFSNHTTQFDDYLQNGWLDNISSKLLKTKQTLKDIDTKTSNQRISTFHLTSSVLSRPEFNYGLDLLHIRDLFRDAHVDATLHGALIHPVTRKLVTSFSATFSAPYDPAFYCSDGFTSELRLYEMLRGEDYVVGPATSSVPPLLTSHKLNISPTFKLPYQPLYRNPLHVDGLIKSAPKQSQM